MEGARLLSKSDYDHGNFDPQAIKASGRSQTSVEISRRSNIARKAFHAEPRLTQPLEPETVQVTQLLLSQTQLTRHTVVL